MAVAEEANSLIGYLQNQIPVGSLEGLRLEFGQGMEDPPTAIAVY
ncbi:MAG TPA: hypothetical protein VJ123_10070 [Anaerolineales bacterium]|nr:hypothetical protein [Anaerolineales bacterium]